MQPNVDPYINSMLSDDSKTSDLSVQAIDDALICKHIHTDKGITLLYNKFSPSLYGFILKNVNDPGQAESILSDVFRIAISRLQTYNSAFGSLLNWMICIVREKIIQFNDLREVAMVSGTSDKSPFELLHVYGYSVQKIANLKGSSEALIKESIRKTMSTMRLKKYNPTDIKKPD